MAAAAKRKKTTWRVICILGDGECNEGSVWESLLFAAQHRLDNLVIVIDSNKLESLDLTENILGIQPVEMSLEKRLTNDFLKDSYKPITLEGALTKRKTRKHRKRISHKHKRRKSYKL